MATIVTRSGKGSALTFVEADANFTNLNSDKIELTNISVGANFPATGAGNINYNSSSGVISFSPPTRQGIGAIGSLSDDNTPSLSGNLDVGTSTIYTNTVDGNISINADGAGTINLNSGVKVQYFQSHAELISETVDTAGTITIDPANGPIQYVGLTGNCTINGFTNGSGGQTVTVILDNSAGAFTITLGGDILVPGGTVELTANTLNVITISLLDDDPLAPLYLATMLNNFQPTV